MVVLSASEPCSSGRYHRQRWRSCLRRLDRLDLRRGDLRCGIDVAFRADLTLTGTNTYSGGTRLEAGTIAVSREANLGAATGGLNFSGGTLKFLSSFDLSSTRNINLSFTGGTFQLNGATAARSPAGSPETRR